MKRVPLEKVEQQHIINFSRSLGATVYVLGTRRKRGDHPGTMQTPGIPDLYIMFPSRGLAIWWEVKREGGRRTEEQVEFGRNAVLTGQRYGHGALRDYVGYLIGLGVVHERSVNANLLPRCRHGNSPKTCSACAVADAAQPI